MCNNISAITLALILLGGECAYSESRPWAKEPVVPLKINDVCQPIAYSEQRIHPDSLLGRRLDINLNCGLLGAVDLDSYLRPYLEGKRPFWPVSVPATLTRPISHPSTEAALTNSRTSGLASPPVAFPV